MGKQSDRSSRTSALAATTPAAATAIAHDVERVQSHVEYVLDGHAGELAPEQRRLLEAAWRSARRAAKLAEDMGDLARADAGELELDLGSCDVGTLVAEAVQRFWPVAAAGRNHIEVEVDGGQDLQADPAQLGRAIDALVEHAVDHAVPGTSIRVRASGRAVVVSYEGTGAPEGDPLGLALAAAVARLHDGRFFAERSGERTVLTLLFQAGLNVRVA